VLGIKKSVAVPFVAFLSFTAPVLGVLVGGLITSYLGGYNSIKA